MKLGTPVRERRPHVARMLVATLVVVAGFALATAPALAATPAGGAFVEGPETILSERQVGNNTLIHLTREAAISGTYTGVAQADQWIVIHADGSFNFVQTLAFTGVVCGQSVKLDFLVVGRGNFIDNVLTGVYTVLGNPPAGRGSGRIVGEPGVGGTYQGRVDC